VEDREKRPYERPEVLKLGDVEPGLGIPQCTSGSSNMGNCFSGSMAGVQCNPSGSSAAMGCTTGSGVV